MWGDSFSTVRIPSVLWKLFSTVGVASVLWRVFSTLGDNINTCRGNISTVGITSVLWRVSVQWGYLQYSGDNISTV